MEGRRISGEVGKSRVFQGEPLVEHYLSNAPFLQKWHIVRRIKLAVLDMISVRKCSREKLAGSRGARRCRRRGRGGCQDAARRVPPRHTPADTANPRTKILDFRGFDSSRILVLRGGILMSKGNSPGDLSRQILVGRILVGRRKLPCCAGGAGATQARKLPCDFQFAGQFSSFQFATL